MARRLVFCLELSHQGGCGLYAGAGPVNDLIMLRWPSRLSLSCLLGISMLSQSPWDTVVLFRSCLYIVIPLAAGYLTAPGHWLPEGLSDLVRQMCS